MAKSFASDSVTIGSPKIVHGSDLPILGAGISAPIGSLYICDADGTHWAKAKGGNNIWSPLGATADANNGDTVTLVAGTPVVSVAGMFRRADASSSSLSTVTGLVISDADPTLPMQIMPTGSLELLPEQWDVVTGDTGGLIPSADYYLDAILGRITTTPQTLPGRSVVNIGHAVYPELMIIAISRPILL